MMTYLLISLIVFLGVYCGLVIGKMAEEELKPGRRYFDWLRHSLFVLVLVLFMVWNPSWLFFSVVAIILLLMSFHRRRETLYYYGLAPMLFISYLYNGFAYLAPLVFLYGFPLGSIYLFENPSKNLKKTVLGMLVRYSGFLVLTILFSVLQLFL